LKLGFLVFSVEVLVVSNSSFGLFETDDLRKREICEGQIRDVSIDYCSRETQKRKKTYEPHCFLVSSLE
jgi:hypothetical protein